MLGSPVDIWIGWSDMPPRYGGREASTCPTDPTPYSGHVLALTLGQAKTIAVIVALLLLGLALLSAWVMKTLAQKAALAVILSLLAVLVWSQRAALQECADKVRAEARTDVRQVDTTCSFVGRDVTISTVRDR